MGLAGARDSARDRNDERDRGDDPRTLQAEREAEAKRAQADTVRAVFAEWVLHKKLAKEGLKSLAEYERLVGKNVLPLYGDTPISSFTKAEVREAIKVMQRRGSASSANRLPEGWHMPERMARHMVGEPTLWEAGTRIMRADSPGAWQAIADAAKIGRDNREAIDACEQAASKAKQPVRCPIRIRPGGR